MGLVIVCIIFYLIGSLPTAYILVKLKHKKNLTIEGTGNIGARNTFDVTNSKLDGVIVLAIDFLKGFVPVLLFLKSTDFAPELVMFPSLFLLIGHNYSVWLKFKGGRGLATAAGIMAVINFTLIILWLIFYFLLSRIIKDIHISTVIALIILPVSIIFLQDFILKFNYPSLHVLSNQFQFLFSFCSSICIIVLIKHINPVLEFFNKKHNF
jgi:glycerol-3-phosphate acyltransferase PlsY